MRLLYVELPEDVDLEKICIKFAAINSSGDIYHMLAFIILSLHEKLDIPKVILICDKGDKTHNLDKAPQKQVNVGTQNLRMMNFAKMLGYEKYFLSEIVEFSAGYKHVREAKASEHLKFEYIIDHRALTSIISKYFLEHQTWFASKVLREGFNKYLEIIEQPLIDNINLYVDRKLAGLKGKGLVVLHNRYSPNANDKQNINTVLAGDIVELLKAKGYEVICIYADSRLRDYDTINGAILHLRPFLQSTDQECGFGKLYHLSLLTKLFELNQEGEIMLKCIVGNTSGTLDLAAFIGHKVLNIHNFTNAKIDYQAARLILQSTFMSILRHFKDLQNIVAHSEKQEINIRSNFLENLPNIAEIPEAGHLYDVIQASSEVHRQKFVLDLWHNIQNFGMDYELLSYIGEMSEVELVLNGLQYLSIEAVRQSFIEKFGSEYSFYTGTSKYIKEKWMVQNDGKSINDPGHLYTDDEIKQLLEHTLPAAARVITAAEFLADPLAALNQHLGVLDNMGTIAVPVHINGNHWTALMIISVNGQYIGLYVDPLGNSMPQYLYSLFAGLFPVHTLSVIQQTNGVDCGPLTVENLATLNKLLIEDGVNINNLIRNPQNYMPHNTEGIDTTAIRARHHGTLNSEVEESSVSYRGHAVSDVDSHYPSMSITGEEIDDLVGLAAAFKWITL